MVGLGGDDGVTTGGDQLGREERVAGHAEMPATEAPAAAEGETGDTDGRAAAARKIDAVWGQPGSDVGVVGAAGDGDGAGGRIDPDAAHPLDIDDQAVGGGEAGVGVAAGADGKGDPGLPGLSEAGGGVLWREANGDRLRPRAGVAGGVDCRRGRVHSVARAKEAATEPPSEVAPG
jgi:hypothetical protein